MQNKELSPALADAADVLSDQLRVHLRRMSDLLSPHSDRLEQRFLARLRALKYERKQRTALAAITLGAAARILASGAQTSGNRARVKNDKAALGVRHFIEQVEYHGRRLAKMNLPPSAILTALEEYDALLTPMVRGLFPTANTNVQWVRDQLHFCVILTLNNAYYQVREAETQAFYELFRAELESRNLEDLLKRFIGIMVPVCNADAGHLFLLDEQSGTWEWKAGALCRKPKAGVTSTAALRRKLSVARHLDAEHADATVILDPDWKRRYRSCWSVPLVSDGGTVGVMQLGFARDYEWLPREQELLAAAAERCMMAAEKARLIEDLAAREEQVRQLAEHMLHVEEMERRRISRELHDETGQSLLCVRLQMELLEQSMPDSEHEWKAKLAETRDLTEKTILEMRRLIAALSPAVLEQLGLGAALRQLVNRFRRLHPCRVRLHLARIGNLPQNTEIIVYRLVQECCNNIAKHSAATHVIISVASAEGRMKLNVEDNGVGFDVEEALARRDSFGLSGMRERVALLGGDFQIHSYPDRGKRERGTKIRIELPISKEGKRRGSDGRNSFASGVETVVGRTAAVLG